MNYVDKFEASNNNNSKPTNNGPQKALPDDKNEEQDSKNSYSNGSGCINSIIYGRICNEYKCQREDIQEQGWLVG